MVAVPHERIVNLLATSVGEVIFIRFHSSRVFSDSRTKEGHFFLSLQIHMKTMPTSMFRLLTGQEVPVYI